MDHCNLDLEVIESLNLLKLPLKRDPRKTNRDFSNSSVNNFLLLRDFRRKFTTKDTKPGKNTGHEDSSTSLILKKTSKSLIFKQCSALSYTSHNKGKPLIKVTVIPKSDLNPGARLLRKQRIVANTIQNTSSNHESPFQTKKVYIVVAGRKKEKVYEIKTTSSENIEKNNSKNESINNIGDIETYIKSLNMEGKRKKNKKNYTKSQRNETTVNICENFPRIEHKCTCSLEADDASYDVRAARSKVRIFGRIGLTEDDKYVLNCQATVDGKPVPTSLSTAEKQSSSSSLVVHKNNGSTTKQRDSILQTDFQNNAVNGLLMNIRNINRISKESQSTQVNFNNKPDGLNFNKTSPYYTTQCCCTHDEYPFKERVKTEYEGENLKPCQSPLVIISVFPKKDQNLTDVVKTVQCTQIENKHDTLPENKRNNIIPEANEASHTKPARGRSPSPKSPKTKSKEVKLMEKVKNKSPLPSKLPKRDQNKKGTNLPKQTLQFFNTTIKKEAPITERKPKPRSPKAKSPLAISVKREPQKNSNALRQSLKPQSPKPKSPNRKVDTGMNTEHLKTKKALVDSYTKNISERMSPNKDKPVKSISKVLVNIESENEYYDVCLRQDRLATDINVRKTMKEASAQKSSNDNEKHGSVENFYPNMSKTHRSSFYRSICENQSNDVNSIVNNTPRPPRDSLEIYCRHENESNTQTRRLNEQHIANTDNTEFAPVKHFTGDNCTIDDPIARDREIRMLLGVMGRKPNSKVNNTQTQVFTVGDQISRHCFYPTKQRENSSAAGLALNDNETLFPCINETRKCNEVNCDESFYNLVYKYGRNSTESVNDQKYNHKIVFVKNKYFHQNIQQKGNGKIDTEQKRKRQFEMVNSSTQYNGPYLKGSTTNQQLILNRNFRVCLQVKQLYKQKPIVLTRRQYRKVKRTIQNTILGKEKSMRCVYNRSILSVGKVKVKPKDIHVYSDKEVQNDTHRKDLRPKQDIHIYSNEEVQNDTHRKDLRPKQDIHAYSKRVVQKDTQRKDLKPKQDDHVYSKRDIKKDTPKQPMCKYVKPMCGEGEKPWKSNIKDPNENVLLFANETRGSVKDKKPRQVSPRQAVSSVEIRYASVAYLTYSSTNIGSIGTSSFANRNKNFIRTLFRGHKKSLTPNLGTSAISLSGANISEAQSMKLPPDAKVKKPFLKRLMSCLVMRPARACEGQVEPAPASQTLSVNSSFDSYHISTSLGAIEMTSSLYDTSDSFYSDHTIHPLSSKLKRGFFNSVRGLLNSRKS